MVINKNMRILSWALGALVLAAIFFAGSARAILAPQIYLAELSLGDNVYKAGDTILGTVSVQNYEDSHAGDLFLQFELLAKEVDGVPTQLIDQKISAEEFELAPGAKTTRSFRYLLPANLPGGEMIFRVNLINGRGEEINWEDAPIVIGGQGIFLELSGGRIVKDGQELSVGAGVYYNPGETVNIKFDINNEANSTAIFFVKAITYKRNPGADIAGSFDFNGVTIGPKAARKASYELPKLTEPETYITEIKAYDSATKLPVSNSLFFRWIISGVNAKILYADVDKNSYDAGDIARVNVAYTGPANSELGGGEGAITAKIVDSQGEVVGQSSQSVKLAAGEISMDVEIKKGVDVVKVETDIVGESGTLDRYGFKLASGASGDSREQILAPEETAGPKAPIAEILIAAGVLAAGLIGIRFFLRKRKINL